MKGRTKTRNYRKTIDGKTEGRNYRKNTIGKKQRKILHEGSKEEKKKVQNNKTKQEQGFYITVGYYE